MTADDNMTLQLDEFKATERYPELDVDSDNYDPLFEKAVAGEYRTALDRYTQSILTGKSQRLPSVSRIAKDMKKEWDSRFGQVSEKAKQEGAKAAKQARGAREATVEAEGRSDARRKVNTDQQELRYRSQRGDDTAIAERLTRSEL